MYFDRDIAIKYCTSARILALKLLEAISESLGLDKDYMEKALGKQGQHMAVNYYPQCPQPELTYGLPSHTDPNALTVFFFKIKCQDCRFSETGDGWLSIPFLIHLL